MSRKEIINKYTLESLSKENLKFRIPLYQRAYAWSVDEVETLIDDLFVAQQKGLTEYFIGNIVVEEKEDNTLDIIDGQQRFTTLYLISRMIDKNYFSLIYEIREEDNSFIQNFNKDNYLNLIKEADSQFKINIDAIYNKMNDLNIEFEKLLSLCKITLTKLPEGIDIVKYFEVMNNRGKQLEKHQILKAKFLNKIKEFDDFDYAKIWDYCSNMNVYIEDSIYYGDLKKEEKHYTSKVRNPLKKFLFNYENIPNIFLSKESNNSRSSINKILKEKKESDTKKEEFYIRKEYGSIVRFPIFLIQVLKVYLSEYRSDYPNVDIDKIIVNERYLIDYFYDYTNFLFNQKQSKDFILFLLKMRILYDYFLFKRDDRNEPFLSNEKNIIECKNNKNILMLQLLFNFTSPQFITQDWIAISLQWLNNNVFNLDKENFYDEYLLFLKNFDKEMAIARLSSIKIIDLVNYKLTEMLPIVIKRDKELKNILNQGTSTPHYWFYKLDYLLWENESIWKENLEKPFENLEYSDIKSQFRLSRLNSIEHVHPQSKKDSWNKNVDDFGNLALISNHMNSALNAQNETEKRLDIQKQINNKTIESLKMVFLYSKYKEWSEISSINHEEKMIEILESDLEVNVYESK